MNSELNELQWVCVGPEPGLGFNGIYGLAEPHQPPYSGEPTARISALVVYDSELGQYEARQVYHRLVQRLKGLVEVRVQWCSAEQLAEVKVAEEASQAAVESEVIVLAVAGARELSHPIRSWLEQCALRKKGRESALVVLMENAGGVFSPAPRLESYLRNFAVQAGMAFFLGNIGSTTSGSPLSVSATLTTQGSLPQSPVQAEFKQPPPSHWGINE
ncbi:MAG: hypothetical protein M1608_16060 [Candidatus Omnitrophica bacterium]|nr:hypothetical protein [Candidatus Omnitrophota bacterium]